MPVSNPASYVTSATGGTSKGPNHFNSTVAPSPQASSQAGSTYAPSPIPPLNPTTNPPGSAGSQATPSLSSSSTLVSGDSSPRIGDNTTSPQTTGGSSTAHRTLPTTASARGLRSDSLSNQPFQDYPPSSIPGAAARPSAAGASLLKPNAQVSSSIPWPSPTATSSTSDASTFTTSFTTYDDERSPALPSLDDSATTSVHRNFPGSSLLHRLSPVPVPLVLHSVSLPSSEDERLPTPPPKSPRTFSLSSCSPARPSQSSPSDIPLSSFMGGSQSKPDTLPGLPRSAPSKLQKPNAHHQAAHHASSSKGPSNSPTGVTARGQVSRSPSPSSITSPTYPLSQSQLAPAPRPYTIPTPTLTPVPATDSSNSAGSKLKRAFGPRRKKTEDGSSSFFGKQGGSSVSLIPQPQTVPESSGSWSKSAAQRQLAAQLLGPSATASPSQPQVKNSSSKTFVGAPVMVPTRSQVPAEGGLVLSPASTDSANTLGTSTSGMARGNVNRASIIQLSPGITSAVDYMREIGVAEEERGGREATGVEESSEGAVNHEDDQRRGDGDSGKTDEGKVECVQQQDQGQPPSMSSHFTSTTAAADLAPMSNSPSSSQTTESSTPADKNDVDLQPEEREREREKVELKENWRKSDSTIGHHNYRTGATSNGGPRSSRPVSMAESFQSAYTIVPGGGSGPGSICGNKRWSTVTGDLDFQVMMEDPNEEEEEASRTESGPTASQASKGEDTKATPTPSAKNINRRSLSLTVGISSSAKPQVTPAYVNVTGSTSSPRTPDVKSQPIVSSSSQSHATAATGPVANSGQNSYPYSESRPRLPPQAPHGPSGSHSSGHTSNKTSEQSQHRFQPGHSSSASLNMLSAKDSTWPVMDPRLTPSPPSNSSIASRNPMPTARPQVPTSFRQTAISMSNGFAKRAAEKIGGIGKKWGISTSSSGSGYSSASSSSRDQGAQPSSFSSSQSRLDQAHLQLGRTHSNESSLASSMKSAASLSNAITSGIVHHVHLPSKDKRKDRSNDKKRRTPNAPSGAYSVASSVTSASTSDSDNFTVSGPVLGRLIRGPVTNWNGTPVTGGVVFGQDLASTARHAPAACTLCEGQDRASRQEGEREKLCRELEHRALPALVIRCAQHILLWGMQEEGLFRVSGRASHVTKLRAEFDTGVDYDMTDCSPGDLDPHAVASIFKAYLRELPAPLLTHGLHRVFEAAVTRELATYPTELSTSKIATGSTPGLPSGPRSGFNAAVRKAPSLTTLAMPSFNGMPAASDSLIQTLRSLVAQLPVENRQLVRTVVELINATAQASKHTKMPLSNLLLVFCPSLSMSPPLLKALCDIPAIWEELPESEQAGDTRRERGFNTSSESLDASDPEDEDNFSDAHEAVDAESQSLQSLDQPPSENISSGYNGSAENSIIEEVQPRGFPGRPPVPTVYLDSRSHSSSSSLLSSQYHAEQAEQRDVLSAALLTSSESIDSLVTPLSSGPPSLANLALDAPRDHYSKQSSRDELGDRPSISPATPIDPTPVQFPQSVPSPQKRRSIPLLSLSSFPSSLNKAPDSAVSPTESDPRTKKPSLRHLFTKRSVASLSSLSSLGKHFSNKTPDSPSFPSRSASDSSSISTPLSAVTAPQSSSSLLPLALDLPSQGSSSSPALGLDIGTADSSVESPTPRTRDSQTNTYRSAHSSSQFSTTSPAPSPLDTQIGHSSSRLGASTSLTNSRLFLLNEGDQEDWMQSVLAAAGAR